MTSLPEYLAIPLIQNMFVATAVVCVLCGIIGAYVVVNRMVSVTGGIAHTVFGGVGFAYYVSSVFLVSWLTPMMGALLFAVIAAIIMTLLKRIKNIRQDTSIGVIWAVGMALGVIFMCFVDRTKVIPASFESILFGDVLYVGTQTLFVMIVLAIAIIAIVAFLYRDFLILTFDETQAKISGLRTGLLDLVLYLLIAITCVMVSNVVGIIMIIALVTIPSAIANLFSDSLKEMMAIGTLLSLGLSIFGLFMALALNTPPGSTVVLVIGLAFVSALMINRIQKRGKATEKSPSNRYDMRNKDDPSLSRVGDIKTIEARFHFR
ncbi:MAG: metal ABC transporter permease [Candidatus Methanomethylophilaceae archaeon]|nr:metal ABC transporter permease [Candidatus Methanomethylophilaceae archaeon]